MASLFERVSSQNRLRLVSCHHNTFRLRCILRDMFRKQLNGVSFENQRAPIGVLSMKYYRPDAKQEGVLKLCQLLAYLQRPLLCCRQHEMFSTGTTAAISQDSNPYHQDSSPDALMFPDAPVVVSVLAFLVLAPTQRSIFWHQEMKHCPCCPNKGSPAIIDLIGPPE